MAQQTIELTMQSVNRNNNEDTATIHFVAKNEQGQTLCVAIFPSVAIEDVGNLISKHLTVNLS